MDETEKKECKILIVDDNSQNIELLISLFEDEYKIAAATDGERAYKIAAGDNPPDLILSDIIMPGMDGYELCNRLKNNPGTKNIPIVFVTAVSEVMDAAKGFAAGAIDFITKPFHPPMVQARVKLHLNLKRKQELLEELAFIDPLTEIPNRRQFDTVLQQELQRAGRSGKGLSVLFMDVDHFKNYNDYYGHGKGDVCLQKIAKTINNTLKRAGDFAARYGGEEFTAVLPYSDREKTMETAGMLMKNIEKMNIPHENSPVADRITISIGIAQVTSEQEITPETIMETADAALYKAKHEGRNTIRILNPGDK